MKINRKIIGRFAALIGCAALIVGSVQSAPKVSTKGAKQSQVAELVTDAYIDANKIFSYVTNDGGFSRDFVGQLNLRGGGGMVFPYQGLQFIDNGRANQTLLFASGLWMGAEDAATGDTLIAMSEYSSEFTPGNMINGLPGPNGAAQKVYKLYRDSLASNPNEDYLNWPVDQGAPVDSVGNPEMLGDQMLWCVFNDANESAHSNDAGGTAPLGVEVQQSIFAFDRQGALGQIMFMRYKIINKGTKTLNNMYISLWSDPDLGGAGDDLVGCDTLLSLGYCYNANDADDVYGSTPPAVGFDFFQGPLVPGTASDTAIMWGEYQPGFTNMPLVSFNKYINGTDPDGPNETYYYMNGLDKNGGPVIDPNTGDTTTFYGNGDPVTATGFLDIDESDRRYMLSTGPIVFAPGDSTEIVAGVVIGQGTDRLTSITAMKKADERAQLTFDNFFQTAQPPVAPVVTVANMDRKIGLSWTDTSEVDPGDWTFQGYNVFQAQTVSGPYKLLATYDIIDSIQTVYSYTVDGLTGDTVLLAEQSGTNFGIRRFHVVDRDAFTGGNLNNFTEYYFRVEAYSVYPFYHRRDTLDPVFFADSFPPIPVLTAPTDSVVTPQWLTPGTDIAGDVDDVLPVDHVTGNSDGIIRPVIVDPYSLTGDTYMVAFALDSVIGVHWNFYNMTTGDTLLEMQTRQGAEEDGLIYDGFYMTVSGPPLEGKDWEYESADPVNVSPVAAADNGYAGGDRWLTGGNHGGELLFGGIFLEPNFWGATTLDANQGDYKTVEIRWRPMVSYTDLNGDGEFTIGEPYVVDDPAQTQKAFMYQTFSGATYEGFFDVPFTAWDVSNPASPRQLNVVVRDRDANFEWSLHANTGDPALPNGGDQQFNYTWILATDYDPTGTLYGDGTGGTIDFWGAPGGAVYDGMWVMWLDERGTSRGMLAEESILRLIPNELNTPSDTFTFVATAPVTGQAVSDDDLADVKTVPNPYYLSSSYESDQFNRAVQFTGLPQTCTIRIFSLAGEMVRTLEKDDGTSFLRWDMTTEGNLPVASGIYVYLVTTPNGSEKVGKMAIFTEAEQLTNF